MTVQVVCLLVNSYAPHPSDMMGHSHTAIANHSIDDLQVLEYVDQVRMEYNPRSKHANKAVWYAHAELQSQALESDEYKEGVNDEQQCDEILRRMTAFVSKLKNMKEKIILRSADQDNDSEWSPRPHKQPRKHKSPYTSTGMVEKRTVKQSRCLAS